MPVPKGKGAPYDWLIVLELHSLWKSHMGVRFDNITLILVYVVFLWCIAQLKSVLKTLPDMLQWESLLDDLLLTRWLKSFREALGILLF